MSSPFNPAAYLDTYYTPGRWYDDDGTLVTFLIANLKVTMD